jgi:hypothetical protein
VANSSGRLSGPILKVPRIDTTNIRRQCERLTSDAARIDQIMLKVNTALAIELQKKEREKLRDSVREHRRPQRRPFSASPLAQALLSDENRHVTLNGFDVNNESFLDRKATMYWRQLEVGAEGRKQQLQGLFMLQSRRGNTRYERPREGANNAVRFVQMRKGPVIQALVGPRVPFRYIGDAMDDLRDKWLNTDHIFELVYSNAGRGIRPAMRRAFGFQHADQAARFDQFRRNARPGELPRRLPPTPDRYIEG